VAAGGQVGGGGVVDPHASGDGGVAAADGQHRLADPGRPDQQHVGRVAGKPQGAQVGDQLRAGRGLGGEVGVGEGERGRQRREPLQAGAAPLIDGAGLDGEQPFQERGVGEAGPGRVVELAGRASAAAVIRRNARWARSFW
jgi:hypothetical protein